MNARPRFTNGLAGEMETLLEETIVKVAEMHERTEVLDQFPNLATSFQIIAQAVQQGVETQKQQTRTQEDIKSILDNYGKNQKELNDWGRTQVPLETHTLLMKKAIFYAQVPTMVLAILALMGGVYYYQITFAGTLSSLEVSTKNAERATLELKEGQQQIKETVEKIPDQVETTAKEAAKELVEKQGKL